MAAGFSDQCSVAVTNTYSTVGTLTRANISALNPTQIRALYGPSSTWAELNAVLKHQVEMRACGTRRSALYEWIMSSNKQGQGKLINVQKVARGPSMIEPFIRGRQQSVINADHWYVVDNQASDSNRVISVKPSFGTGLDLSASYFLPGKRIYLTSKASGTNAFSVAQFKVVSAAVNSEQIDITATLEQGTTGMLGTNSTSTSGLVFVGPNNVADVESWCYNALNTNGTKLVPFFYQTRRWQRAVDSEYKKIFANLMENNAWYAMFQDLPMAERNRQDEVRDQKEFMNSFFFGTPISNNQTITGWPSLTPIGAIGSASVDPGTQSAYTTIAYRANMVGVLPQLKSCGQFTDSAGAAVEIKPFLESTLYDIYRARESQGRAVTEIDIYTSQDVADQFMTAFIKYSKEKTGDIVRLNIDEGTTTLGFPFRRYKLYKPHGVYVNIITDPFFDDLDIAASSSSGPSDATLGKFLFVLDLGSGGTIYPAVLGSNRKQYTSGQIEDLAKIDVTYACAMENPTIERTLTSTTTTVIVECPKNSIIVANFSGVQHTPE